MAKVKKSRFQTYQDEEYDILQKVQLHFKQWSEDNDTRRTRPGGWNDITDAYWGKLPRDWPYTNRVVDPRIRTTINEKDNRILNAKLQGHLVPREGGDQIKAKINNQLLDFQWDNANEGGSMLIKLKQSSQDARLYASKFGLVKWKYECEYDSKGKVEKVLFNGNEFKPLDIRDCGIDPTADHVRNAKWFQVRDWAKMEDLEQVLDTVPDKETKEKLKIKLSKIKEMMGNATNSDRRDTRYENRILSLKNLTDRVGSDKSYPVVELVTEYRVDRWITFSPRHNVILRDIENPYKHRKIPIVQLRYNSIQGDPLGESQVEPVLGLWRSIQAILCGFLDSYNTHIKPPLKILDGQVRIETIIFGPEAQMIMNRPDAVTEFGTGGGAIQYFQSAYQAAIAAFNTAMGEISQGVSSIDPFDKGNKTATEIKQSTKQQNVQDQADQNSLGEMLQDMMSMWITNNQQFLFQDEDMKEYIMRIVGRANYDYFVKAGMADNELSTEATQAIGDVIAMQGGNISDDDITQLIQAGEMPKHPIFGNPNEKNPEKYEMKPKLEVSEMGDEAELIMIPEDLEGNYDYIPDVISMAAGAQQDMITGRQQMLDTALNPQIQQQLAAEQKRIKIGDLLISMWDGLRLDGERFIEDIPPPEMPMGGGVPQEMLTPEMNPAMMGNGQGGMPQAPPQVPQVPPVNGQAQIPPNPIA